MTFYKGKDVPSAVPFEMKDSPGLLLRRATMGDAEQVFRWRNDPKIVQAGASRRLVTWNEHLRWFRESVALSRRMLLIIQVEGVDVGLVRYDQLPQEGEVELSIYLLDGYTGRGLGSVAFASSLPNLYAWRNVTLIVATVRKDNPNSLRFFERLGFRPKKEQVLEKESIVLVLPVSEWNGKQS